MLHQDITVRIIRAYYTVYNTLGYGFLEKVYENALVHELKKQGLCVVQQVGIDVFYDGVTMGEYFADILVENCVIIELKAVEAISEGHQAQLRNYLRATPIEVGLVFNFGPKPDFAREIFTNDRKNYGTEKHAIKDY